MKIRDGLRVAFGLVCAALAAFAAASFAGGAGEAMREQERALLLEQIRQAAVSCYACEGRYPMTIGYLEEHYGLQYNRDRFSVMYDAFASNIMPDIAVSDREEERL